MLSRTFSPSIVLLNPSTVRTSFTDLAVWTEVDVRIFTAGWLDVIKLDLFRARFLEVACLDFEALALKREMNSCNSLIFSSFFLIGFFHLTDQKLAGFIPEVIVTGIELDLAIIDICDLCADLIQEVTVMGYNDDGIVKVDQEFFEPCDRIKV